MKLTCPLSGITFHSDYLNHLEGSSIHPIFSISLNTVLGKILPKAVNETLTKEEMHLLGSYLLNQLPIERWEGPLHNSKTSLSENWYPFWLKNVEALASIARRLSGKKPKDLPTFAVQGFESLWNLKDWIILAHTCINQAYAPISEEALKRNKTFRANLLEESFATEAQCNAVIEKILRGSLSTPREKEKFPELMANWAASVGDFPNTIFKDSNGARKTIRNFWKEILRNAFDLGAKGEGYSNILTSDISIGDLEELSEHIRENIPAGTIQSAAIWKELSNLTEVIQEFREVPVPKKVQTISVSDLLGEEEISPIPGNSKEEQADPAAPKREDFVSLAAYMKAKLQYKNATLKAGENK